MEAAASIPLPRGHWPSGAGQKGAKAFLAGGGIASLTAAFMVRDDGVPGKGITILEELGAVGGSLDGAGSPAVHQGRFDPHVLPRAFRALHDVRA